jgi:opacity protein-like surface antigen
MRARFAAVLLLALAAGVARAEPQIDLYAGGAHTPSSDMTLVVNTPGGNADHEFHDVKWKNSLELGARAGYWLASAPWYGVGLDFAHFDANIPGQSVDTTIQGVTAPAALQAIDVSVLMLGFDVVRLRYKGSLQPYFSAGPALFRIKATNRGNPELTSKSATDNALGYKIGAGLSWTLRKDLALFGEFRYTHVKAEPVLEGAVTGSGIPLRFDLNTHHLIAGVTFGF